MREWHRLTLDFEANPEEVAMVLAGLGLPWSVPVSDLSIRKIHLSAEDIERALHPPIHETEEARAFVASKALNDLRRRSHGQAPSE